MLIFEAKKFEDIHVVLEEIHGKALRNMRLVVNTLAVKKFQTL